MFDDEKIRKVCACFWRDREDPDREGLKETPERIARMCREIFGGLEESPHEPLQKRFPHGHKRDRSGEGYSLLQRLRASSAPFYGKVHVAYLPEGRW